MSLLDNLVVPNSQVNDLNYYVLLETHIPYLKTHEQTQYVEVTGQQAEMYRGDFHGLLDSLRVNKKYHYIVTRVNGLLSSTDYDGVTTGIYVPNPSTISSFLATYESIED